MAKEGVPATIDEYLAGYDGEMRKRMDKLRALIKKVAPGAEERMSWSMPTFWQQGNVVHFAAAKNHIGLYPGASGVEAFAGRLGDYKTSKGAIQLPMSRPVDWALVEEIVRYRVAENERWAEEKAEAKRAAKAEKKK